MTNLVVTDLNKRFGGLHVLKGVNFEINATGNAANNTITGNTGTNTLTGGAGDDTYFVQNTTDTVIELNFDPITGEVEGILAGAVDIEGIRYIAEISAIPSALRDLILVGIIAVSRRRPGRQFG